MLHAQDHAAIAAHASRPAGSLLGCDPLLPLSEQDRTRRPLPALLTKLIDAACGESRRAVIRRRLDQLGFDWLAYGRISSTGPAALTGLCASFTPPRWVQRYCREEYVEVDRRLADTSSSGLPYIWDLSALARPLHHMSESKTVRFTNDMRDAGACSGVCMRLPGRYACEDAFASLSSRRRGCEWIDDGLLGRVLTLAACVHQFHSRYAVASERLDDVGTELTPTQVDVMRCLMRGLSDKAIACELKLNLHNVDYHLRQLRRRFGASNRVKLVQEAMRVLEGAPLRHSARPPVLHSQHLTTQTFEWYGAEYARPLRQ